MESIAALIEQYERNIHDLFNEKPTHSFADRFQYGNPMVAALTRKVKIKMKANANWGEFARVVEGWVNDKTASPFQQGVLTLPDGPQREFLAEARKGNIDTIWLAVSDDAISKKDLVAGISDFVPRKLGPAQRIIESIEVYDA